MGDTLLETYIADLKYEKDYYNAQISAFIELGFY